MTATVVLYHNPKCSTSRKALDLLRARGIEPTVVDYLKTGWDRATLQRLAVSTGGGLSGLLRRKDPTAAALLDQGASDDAIIQAALTHPVVIERPIVETPKGARIGRPLERVLDVL